MSTTANLEAFTVSLKGYTFTVFVDEDGNESIHRPHPRGEILQSELMEAEMLGDEARAKKIGRQLALIRKRIKVPEDHSFDAQRAELRSEWQVEAVSSADARDRFMGLFGITDAPLKNFTVESATAPKAAPKVAAPRRRRRRET